MRRCNERIHKTFADAAVAAKASGEQDVMHLLGQSFGTLLAVRHLLLNQLHAHAACDDQEIRDEMRRGFAQLVELVERETGADPETVRRFFAHGMLLNVLTAMSAGEVDEHWAHLLLAPPGEDGP